MKHIYINIWTAIALLAFISCVEEEALTPGSNLDTTTPEFTELDTWIEDNFTDPYNIEIIYKWESGLTDQTRYLFPPHVDSVKSLLNIVKKVWIDSYTDVGGVDFVKIIAPRQIVLLGGVNRNPSGTITLGTAEAGKRITLFNANLIQKTSRASITRFLKTIQHEYTHILNQTRPYDLTYGEITPTGYTAQWFNETDVGSRRDGFITAYARASPSEDFAEMVSEMLSRNRKEWDQLIDDIGGSNRAVQAKADIRSKENIVVDYYETELGVDFYVLQDSVYNQIIRITK